MSNAIDWQFRFFFFLWPHRFTTYWNHLDLNNDFTPNVDDYQAVKRNEWALHLNSSVIRRWFFLTNQQRKFFSISFKIECFLKLWTLQVSIAIKRTIGTHGKNENFMLSCSCETYQLFPHLFVFFFLSFLEACKLELNHAHGRDCCNFRMETNELFVCHALPTW